MHRRSAEAILRRNQKRMEMMKSRQINSLLDTLATTTEMLRQLVAETSGSGNVHEVGSGKTSGSGNVHEVGSGNTPRNGGN